MSPTPRCQRCHEGPAQRAKGVLVCRPCRGTDWFLNLKQEPDMTTAK